MSFGIEIYDSSGNSLLSMSDRTIKLAADVTVTTPTSTPTTVSVSNNITPTNSVAILENGADAEITSTGVVTLKPQYFEDSGLYNTSLKVVLL